MRSVRVPASSANVGPGFDVFGLALSLGAKAGICEGDNQGREAVVEGHPATQAFRIAGGVGRIWVDSPIPSGRGLGFSGAVRVAGAGLGLAEKNQVSANEMDAFFEKHRGEIVGIAAELEGHYDNVSASVYGGFVSASPDLTVQVPISRHILDDVRVMTWVPFFQTATAKSRSALPTLIERRDAVFNIARSTQLIVALVTGDLDVLKASTADRLHQSRRLAETPICESVIDCFADHGAIASWLSGSGPTVAAFVELDQIDHLSSMLAADFAEGTVKVLSIDTQGLRVDQAA